MGSYAATMAYLDKLDDIKDAGGLSGVVMSVSDASMSGDHWYFDEKRTLTSYPNVLADDVSQIQVEGIDAGDITYQSSSTGTPTTMFASPAFIAHWGLYTHGVEYPQLSGLTITGNTGGWFGFSVESYSMVYGHSSHGDPTDFFAEDAFGGTAYSNTPLGWSGHTAEPYLSGVPNYCYARSLAAGWTFAEAAWAGQSTSKILAVGYPYLER